MHEQARAQAADPRARAERIDAHVRGGGGRIEEAVDDEVVLSVEGVLQRLDLLSRGVLWKAELSAGVRDLQLFVGDRDSLKETRWTHRPSCSLLPWIEKL